MSAKKRIMQICGGTWQVPLIQYIKAQGYEVVNSNLYEDSPCFAYADFKEVVDVLDKEKNLEIAKRYNVDAVVTDQSDISVPTVAYIADKLGLAGIGVDTAKLFTNKLNMRQFCQNHGFASPEFALCHSADDVISFIEKVGRKIVIKPLDSQSSRGVFVIEKNEDIRALFEESKHYSKDGESVIAERFITGTEFTVDGIMTPSGHRSLCISQKAHYPYNECIASELFFSYSNPNYDYDLLRATNDAMLNATGLRFGLTHVEYRYENGRYYLMEFAARGGGTKIASHIVPLMSGVDNYGYLLKCALGETPDVDMIIDPSLRDRCAVLKFFSFDTHGKPVKAIQGLEEIKENDQVVDIMLEFDIGDRLQKALDDRYRVGFYIAYEQNAEKLHKLMQWIEDTLVLAY